MASDEAVRNLISREEVMGNLVATASSSVRSPLHETLCNHVNSVINSVEKKDAGRKHIDVRRNLTSDELQTLIKDYPEYSVKSTACESGTHSMAACYRFLETEYLLDFLPKRESKIWDIGGNWFSHMKYRPDMDIHCCCPILSVRDCERLETRCANMQRFMRSDRERSLKLYASYHNVLREQKRRKEALESGVVGPQQLDGSVFCENTFQECVQRAEPGTVACAIAIHSVYDIEINSLVSALKEKGIAQMYGCMLFPPGILVGQTEGDLPAVKGKFSVKNGKISFFFLNDPNAGYSHNLKDYLRYFEDSYVEIDRGLFSIELMQMRGDTMFFKITDVTAAAYHLRMRNIRMDETFKCIPMGPCSSVVVPVYSWDNSGLHVSSALIPRNIVEQGASYIMKSKDKDLSVAVLKNYLSSVNNSYIFNGSQVRQGEKIGPRLISQLAVTLYLREKVYRERENKIINHFENLFIDDISLSDLVGNIVWGKNRQAISMYYHFLKMEIAKWFDLTLDVNDFDICDPPLYVEIHDRWKVNVKGNIPIGSLFDCEDEVKDFERRSAEKKRIAEDIVNKVTGISKPGPLLSTDSLLKLNNITRLFLAASVVSAHKGHDFNERASCSSDVTSLFRSATSSSNSSSLVSEKIEKPEVTLSEDLPTWEVVLADDFSFQKIDGSLMKRTPVPSRPATVSSYGENARAEYLYYLLASVVNERAQMIEIIHSFRMDHLFSERVASPQNAFIMSGNKGNWVLKKPRCSDLGHAFAVHFNFKGDSKNWDECMEYCELREIHWDKSSEILPMKPLLPVHSGYYLFCDLTKLCNNWLIYNNNVENFYKNKSREVTFELIEGVPGCGKSTMILESANSRRQAVVGEGRKATDDLRNRFIKQKGWNLSTAQKKVRTIDSLLMSPGERLPKVEGFHFDEALKVHYGAILLCADKMDSKYVIAQGDRAQLPMINRVEGVTLKFAQPDYSKIKITPKLTSYRIPADVAYYLTHKGFYKEQGVVQTVTTKNKVTRSMFARTSRTHDRFISLLDLPIVPKAQYLTFLQADKENVIAYLKQNHVQEPMVNTVHEAQGGTFDEVILVRLQSTENEIYPNGVRSSSYLVVGTSRHTKRFTYCTVVEDSLSIDILGEGGLKDVPEMNLLEHIIV